MSMTGGLRYVVQCVGRMSIHRLSGSSEHKAAKVRAGRKVGEGGNRQGGEEEQVARVKRTTVV